MKQDVGNTLDVLPLQQKQAMEKIIKDIDWLLKDEIASALRTHGPVTEENLDKVSQHVQNSVGAENCLCERRYFMFVTGIIKGSDLSLPLFICELESATLDQYRLKRVGKYYCVVVKPAHVDDESDVESAQIDEIRENAKIKRKGLGHRRSQSDFINDRQRLNKSKDFGDSSLLVSKSHSVPSVYLASDFYLGSSDSSASLTSYSEQLVVGQPPMGSLWQPVETIATSSSISKAERTSSKGDSSVSLNPEDDIEYLKRSLSFCGVQGEKACERRRFSLPNIFMSG